MIIWTHGGGYVVGSMHSHRKVAAHLAKAAGTRAMVSTTAGRPSTPPGPGDGRGDSYRWLLDQGVAPGHVATTGDSAGGGLCTSMVLSCATRATPSPAASCRSRPVRHGGQGRVDRSRADVDVLVQRDVLLNMATMFLGDSPAVGPAGQPALRRSPRAAADADPGRRPRVPARRLPPLRPPGLRAGVDVTVEVEPEMQHVSTSWPAGPRRPTRPSPAWPPGSAPSSASAEVVRSGRPRRHLPRWRPGRLASRLECRDVPAP